MKGQIEKSTVELFAEELYKKFEMKGDGEVYQSLLDKFKELEKERIKMAARRGYLAVAEKFDLEAAGLYADEYYENVYGGGNK